MVHWTEKQQHAPPPDGAKPPELLLFGAKPPELCGAKPPGAKPPELCGAKPPELFGAKPLELCGAKPPGAKFPEPVLAMASVGQHFRQSGMKQ